MIILMPTYMRYAKHASNKMSSLSSHINQVFVFPFLLSLLTLSLFLINVASSVEKFTVAKGKACNAMLAYRDHFCLRWEVPMTYFLTVNLRLKILYLLHSPLLIGEKHNIEVKYLPKKQNCHGPRRRVPYASRGFSLFDLNPTQKSMRP